MVHFERDYTKSPAPAFDAVEDIRDYLGDLWREKCNTLRQIPDAYHFTNAVSMFLGIEGFPVKAWYEHIFGGGTYDASFAAGEQAACDKAREQGRQDKQTKLAYMNPRVHEAYLAGIEEGKANG